MRWHRWAWGLGITGSVGNWLDLHLNLIVLSPQMMLRKSHHFSNIKCFKIPVMCSPRLERIFRSVPVSLLLLHGQDHELDFRGRAPSKGTRDLLTPVLQKVSVGVSTVVSWLLGLFYYCCCRLLLYVHIFEDILYLLLTAQFCYKACVEISSLNETSLAWKNKNKQRVHF